MKLKPLLFSILLLGSIPGFLNAAPPLVGKPAPDFALPASDGKTYHLADYKGRWVVLEWFNRDCPFIRKHYDSGHMQSLQEKYTKQGVAWFSIASSAPGKEGYLTAAETESDRAQEHSASTATLLDPDGKVGRLYAAKTTPHMFVINPAGLLVYKGAIDNRPSTDKDDIPGATNYVANALDEGMAGKAISIAETRSYGCSVKYQ